MARDLIAEFGGSPPAETLWDRCEQAGLEMSDVGLASLIIAITALLNRKRKRKRKRKK